MTEISEQKKNEHWKFLEEFIHDLRDFDMVEVPTGHDLIRDIELIKYGFEMAWDHAWKHALDESEK